MELGSRGGHRRTVYSPDGLKDFPAPKTPAELMDLMARSMVAKPAAPTHHLCHAVIPTWPPLNTTSFFGHARADGERPQPIDEVLGFNPHFRFESEQLSL